MKSSKIQKHDALTFEYNQITTYIFIGTNKCCLHHFRKKLLQQNILADISVEEKHIDHPFGVLYYLWLPTKDHFPLTFHQLFIGVKFIDELVKNKIKMYVHCRHGHGRSPLLVAAYFVYKGMSSREALRLIKKKRPSMHLNERQKKALLVFSRRIK